MSAESCLTRMDNKIKIALCSVKIKKSNKEKVNCQERDLLGILISQVGLRNVIRRWKNQDKFKKKKFDLKM